MSPYLSDLGARIGHDLLLLPGVTAVIRHEDTALLARQRDTARWNPARGGCWRTTRHWRCGAPPSDAATLDRMARLEPTRLPELMTHDRAALDALLDTTIVGQVAFVDEHGLPGVLPTAVARHGDELLVHGSTGSRWMRLVAGAPAAVSVTAVDGVVVARSTFESSLAYRSAVIFGAFRRLDGDEKAAALDLFSERLLPGRTREVRASTRKELAATMLLALPLDRWSLRVSDGWPEDPDDDRATDAWAGRVWFGARPVARVEAAPDLRDGVPVPPSVSGLRPAH
jgi:nitroimidazol reductase NimA-like FMN-containing flavoprotein (pyridoxamine 5'-phosphate oxidase superfamily)